MRQLDQLQQFVDPFGLALLVDLAQTQRVGNVASHAHVGEQRQRLEHHAEIAFAGRYIGEVFAGHGEAAAGRCFEAGDHAQQCGFSAAGRPQETHQLTFRDAQVDVFHDLHRAELLVDVFND